jgi:hypothetical protein
VGETGQNDDQQRLSELQRKAPNRRRQADLARARFATGAFHILVPCRLSIVEGQATNMSAVKSNKLAERAHAHIVASRSVCVVPNVRAHRFELSLPEQAINKRDRGSMVRDEAVVSRQRHPELAQVRQISQTIA